VNGKTIVVTGASSGIGKATALAFLEAGWRVGLIGRRAEALEAMAADRSEALALPCDVTDPSHVEAAFDRALAGWGRIDALFNNAGVGLKSVLIDDITIEQWCRVIDTNITGMFLCARAAFGRMRKQQPQGGRIINNGSISAHVPRPGSAPYTASKHAVTGLTRSISLDGRPFDICCGQIDIGNAASHMTERMAKGVPQADGTMKPEPTMDVQHVADAVVHMAGLPLEANVQFMTIMSTKMPFIGRG